MNGFYDPFGLFGSPPTPERAHEMVRQWRRIYYELDARLNKMKRAVEMHPEKYVMGFTISPELIYEHEAAKARYEMGLELVKMLGSKPEEPKAKNTDGSVILWKKLIDDTREKGL